MQMSAHYLCRQVECRHYVHIVVSNGLVAMYAVDVRYINVENQL